MDWRASLFGVHGRLSLRRGAGRPVVVAIPPSPLLEALRSAPKTNDMDKAKASFERYRTGQFWQNDPGYAFAKPWLRQWIAQETRVLDVGCAYGQLAWYLKSLGIWEKAHYHGVDVVEAAVELAATAHPEGTFEATDAQAGLGVATGDFDVVWSKGTICSAAFPQELLAQILAVQAPRVLLPHTAMACEPIHGGFATTIYSAPHTAYLFTILDQAGFTQQVNAAGYDVTICTPRDYTVPVEHMGTYRLYDVVLTASSKSSMKRPA